MRNNNNNIRFDACIRLPAYYTLINDPKSKDFRIIDF